MAAGGNYKQRSRQDRRAILESNFSKGMMSSDGIIDEGYMKSLVNFVYEKESRALVPRPGLGVDTIILPDPNGTDSEDYLSTRIGVKASKECAENGSTFDQIILGKLETGEPRLGDIWVSTSEKESDPTLINFSDEFSETVSYSISSVGLQTHKCYFYTSGDSSIHKVRLEEDSKKRIEFPVGSFAYGNSYYFFGEESETTSGEGDTPVTITTPGLFRTKFNAAAPNQYMIEAVEPKECTVSEAVTYGYNLLLGDNTYVFENSHTANVIQFQGILPYEPGTSNLMMTPKTNQPIDLVCYYDVANNNKYDIVWEWRETTASDWNTLEVMEEVTFSSSTTLKVTSFQPPAKTIMIRVSAYPYEDGEVSEVVERAMTVGFDFTIENYGEANALEMKKYDLTTADGMASWNGRLAVWGVPADPTILFLSDYNDPSYFPYPNNITVFDAPIIYVTEFMDTLLVFTTDRLYQVSMLEDGNSWKSTVLQSHLNINYWDRHLIQTVRNMVYFKSGNYYYMMVPKAQSTTGELVLAPVTTPITSFFDYFSVNVQNILKNTYGYTESYSLLTYYNFLDYEDIHNMYVYAFDETANVLHFDVIYNTVDRTWRVWVFETTNLLLPHKHDATQTGLLATTSLVNIKNIGESTTTERRIIQIYRWNKLSVNEYYVPSALVMFFYTGSIFPSITNTTVTFPSDCGSISNGVWTINDGYGYVDEPVLYLAEAGDFFAGFSKLDIRRALVEIYRHPEDYFTFENYQFLDTGYCNDVLQNKKRYRELQLQINNLDKKNLDFGVEYLLDGATRKTLYKYETSQEIDELDDDYGVVYVDSTPYMEVDFDEVDLSNQWTIDQNLTPEVSLWKVRMAISGKGSAPRLKLFSQNGKRFALMGINWISKLMNMR